MTLTYGLKTPKDLLEKLKRDKDLLYEEVTSDRFFNFSVTGYSIIDWVQNHPQSPSTTVNAVKLMRKNPPIQICGDIANASKHFILTKRKPTVSRVESDSGLGLGRLGYGGLGEGEEEITISLKDGTELRLFEFIESVISSWEEFFSKNVSS